MSSLKFKSHENNTLKIEMSHNYENHSEDNGKYHFINTYYFNFYTIKSKRLVPSLALGTERQKLERCTSLF
jgi:hypothetical protein